MDRVLVTGGSGFLGISLVQRLVELDYRPRVLDLRELSQPALEDKVDFIKGDVRNLDLVRKVCQGVDTVFHLAAAVLPTRGRKTFMSINVGGTRNLLQASLEQRVQQVVHVSTSAVYGIPRHCPITEETEFRPLGDYGWAKFYGEEECRRYRAQRLKVCILRPRTILGPGRLGIFHILFDWIKRNKPIPIIGSGHNLFQLISLQDMVEACLLAAERGENQDFNIGAEEYSTVRADLEALIQYAGSGSRLLAISPLLAKTSLWTLDRLRLSPLMDWHYLTADKPFYFDISKAKALLGWQPKDSNQKMLKENYDWYVANFQQASAEYGLTHRSAAHQGILLLLRNLLRGGQ
ncbi:MAG: NAD(P)-dependent oxidoreductase [Chloroflexi bacterium]|nr:NAD(P)-dependent oxidoreductase [Chloroflexota bacterium]